MIVTRGRAGLRQIVALALTACVAGILSAPAWHDNRGHAVYDVRASAMAHGAEGSFRQRILSHSQHVDACSICLSQRLLSQSGFLAAAELAAPVASGRLSPHPTPFPATHCEIDLNARAPPSR